MSPPIQIRVVLTVTNRENTMLIFSPKCIQMYILMHFQTHSWATATSFAALHYDTFCATASHAKQGALAWLAWKQGCSPSSPTHIYTSFPITSPQLARCAVGLSRGPKTSAKLLCKGFVLLTWIPWAHLIIWKNDHWLCRLSLLARNIRVRKNIAFIAIIAGSSSAHETSFLLASQIT